MAFLHEEFDLFSKQHFLYIMPVPNVRKMSQFVRAVAYLWITYPAPPEFVYYPMTHSPVTT
jgi:hypothetical protein